MSHFIDRIFESLAQKITTERLVVFVAVVIITAITVNYYSGDYVLLINHNEVSTKTMALLLLLMSAVGLFFKKAALTSYISAMSILFAVFVFLLASARASDLARKTFEQINAKNCSLAASPAISSTSTSPIDFPLNKYITEPYYEESIMNIASTYSQEKKVKILQAIVDMEASNQLIAQKQSIQPVLDDWRFELLQRSFLPSVEGRILVNAYGQKIVGTEKLVVDWSNELIRFSKSIQENLVCESSVSC